MADIRRDLKRITPHLLRAAEENLNEADTVQRIVKVFEDVLGYDALSEVSREASVKDRFVDLALKIDGIVRLLVEAKSAATVLRDRHIEQALNYAANGNIRWVLLTNGVQWNLYHVTFEEGIESVLAFSTGVSDERCPELLGLLHRKSIARGELDKYWEHKSALSAASIARAVFCEDTLRFIRREIRRHEDVIVDEEDLANAIHEMLSAETREAVGPVKIRRKRQRRARNSDSSAPPTATPASPPAKA